MHDPRRIASTSEESSKSLRAKSPSPTQAPSDAAVAAAYDSRADEYIQVAGSLDQTDAADRALIAAWRDATTGRLLDAGCGPGLWTDFLHDGSRDVAGIDISKEFLASARSTYPHLTFEEASFRELPVEDASFDGILAWYSLIHTPPEELPMVLREFARALAPGGSILIGFFDGPPLEPFAHAITQAYFWSAQTLSALAQAAGFAVVSAQHRSRVAAEASIRPHASITAIRRHT